MELNKIYNDNCINVLKKLDSNSIDAIVTDPPYGYSFMGKDWDKAVVSVSIWKECLRVLKHGAFAAIMSAPRQDVLSRMIVNLQDAGFRTDFTSIYWTYASGFPKAMNVSKLINKRNQDNKNLDGSYAGFQPKPAVEVILIVMKPLRENTFVDQALKNGKGVTWLDDCRIPFQNDIDYNSSTFGIQTDIKNNNYGTNRPSQGNIYATNVKANPHGRFPANLLVSDDVLNDGNLTKSHINSLDVYKKGNGSFGGGSVNIKNSYDDTGSYSRYFDLDKWFDTTFPFLITPKADDSEKNRGLDNWIKKTVTDGRTSFKEYQDKYHAVRSSKNIHPTVKPIKLMSWLIKLLVHSKKDIILDPFCGTGTTCIAAKLLKHQYIGIELNKEYAAIAERRLDMEHHKTEKNILDLLAERVT